MSLVDDERAKYEDVWAVDAYQKHSPGEQMAPVFVDATGALPGHDTVLDAGCGAGRGALALDALGFKVCCCDLTDEALLPAVRNLPFWHAALWDDLGEKIVDWTFCCDVMEHIPTQFTMLAVSRMLTASRLGVFMSISHKPDVMGFWVGKALHETVMPFTWWRDNLSVVGELVEARDLLSSGIYYVRPK